MSGHGIVFVMIFKILSPLLIAFGWFLYIVLDGPNGQAVRWPGVSLMALGFLLIPFYHLFPVYGGKLVAKKPLNLFFKISIILIVISLLAFCGLIFAEGFDAFWFFYATIFFGVLGLLTLVISLFTPSNNWPVLLLSESIACECNSNKDTLLSLSLDQIGCT